MMANTKTPLIQNCNQPPNYLEELPLKCKSVAKEPRRPVPRRSPSNLRKLSKRLRERKELFRKRRWIVDLEFLFAMAGVAVMVVYIEMYYSVPDASVVRLILEIAITATTVLLVASVGLYHWAGICICMLDNSLESWRLAVTGWTVVKIISECILCSIQPVPDFRIQMNGTNFTNTTITPTINPWNTKHNHNREVPTNIILSLVMLCRLYLIGRMAVVHSNTLIDSALNSYGALCKVTINAQFIFRALMSTHPGSVLGVIMLTIFMGASWSMHTCEKFASDKGDQSSAIQSMWVISVTFLTVGYGDLVPVSTCGRVISILTGLSGVGIVALMVAVLANKLEQTRPERYISSFIRRVRLGHTRKNAAADVMKQGLKIWKLRKNGHRESGCQLIEHRRKFINAVRLMREATRLDLQIKQSEIGLIDLQYSLIDLNELNKKNTLFQNDILQRVTSIETGLHELYSQIRELNTSITNLNVNQ